MSECGDEAGVWITLSPECYQHAALLSAPGTGSSCPEQFPARALIITSTKSARITLGKSLLQVFSIWLFER